MARDFPIKPLSIGDFWRVYQGTKDWFQAFLKRPWSPLGVASCPCCWPSTLGACEVAPWWQTNQREFSSEKPWENLVLTTLDRYSKIFVSLCIFSTTSSSCTVGSWVFSARNFTIHRVGYLSRGPIPTSKHIKTYHVPHVKQQLV